MARVSRVSPHQARPYVRLVYFFARRQLGGLTGRRTDRMIEPLEVYAHVPRLLMGYGRLEQTSAKLHGVSKRLQALALLKAATMTHCEYCIDIGSQVGRRWGLSNEELLALPSYRSSDLFNDVEKLVLDYAVGMSKTPVGVPDSLVTSLREHFNEAQLVELTHLIALENLRGRFNGALGIGSAGFSDGMVCATPTETDA